MRTRIDLVVAVVGVTLSALGIAFGYMSSGTTSSTTSTPSPTATSPFVFQVHVAYSGSWNGWIANTSSSTSLVGTQ
jgi:hypothetical protein